MVAEKKRSKDKKGKRIGVFFMNLHEYQAKNILREYGMPIPLFWVVSSLSELKRILDKEDLQEAVLKIQVHAGGRGKAGGVVVVSKDQIFPTTLALLGMRMVNKQTGPEGMIAEKILITVPVKIQKEYYLSITIDRELAKPVLIASQEGGVDIEEIASKCPEKIIKVPIELSGHIRPYHLLRLVKGMEWNKEEASQFMKICRGLARIFLDKDALLIEVNPLVVSDEGIFLLDVKMIIDSDALFRQSEMARLFDPSQLSKKEREAKDSDLAYVGMEGNIGCMVNGAGLAMATMDLIYHCGGAPANFLDVGGGASKEKVKAGFTIILEDPKVRGILVNIFGGIMDCAVLAEGIIEAVKGCALVVPLVVRMEGTNVEKARDLFSKSGLLIETAISLQEAAEKIIAAVNSQEKHGHSN